MVVRVVGLVVVLLCVGGAASAAAPASPCKLATAAQVKAAFGGTVGAGKVDTSLPSAPTCHFKVTHSNLGTSGEAVVFVTPGQSAATFKLAKKYVPGAVTVPGVGTAAFYNPHTTSIELLKGNAVASAQGIFLGANAAKVKADVIVLAKAVAKNL
jgi:type IV secretory pathway protease TraF